MNKKIILKCSNCKKEFSFGKYICKNEEGILEVIYNYYKIPFLKLIDRKKQGLWRYHRLLPFVKERISLKEGGTPLLKSREIGPNINVQLYFKNEGQNPTGSFKDRAASIMLSVEKELGHKNIITTSSGNASGAIACYSSISNINCHIFMCNPTKEKLINTLSYGPKIFLMDTEIGNVFQLAEMASSKFGWENLITTAYHNPFTIEGYKTISFELFEEMGIPDVVIAPMGSGSLVIGLWKGFYELKKIGVINRIPRIIGVQSTACNPIYQAFNSGEKLIKPLNFSNTIAGGIGVSNPGISGKVGLEKIRNSQGAVIQVDDSKILKILEKLPREEGIFGGPTGVVSIAGAIKAREENLIKMGEKVVSIITESGFKDLRIFRKGLKIPKIIQPKISIIEKYVNQ